MSQERSRSSANAVHREDRPVALTIRPVVPPRAASGGVAGFGQRANLPCPWENQVRQVELEGPIRSGIPAPAASPGMRNSLAASSETFSVSGAQMAMDSTACPLDHAGTRSG